MLLTTEKHATKELRVGNRYRRKPAEGGQFNEQRWHDGGGRMSSQPSSHRQNLTQERRRLRALHRDARPEDQINYRGHTIRRENGDLTQSGCFRILDEDGQFVDAVEPSDFYNEDDWVRYIDLVIQHGRERAKDWLRNELHWGWDA